MVAVSAVTPHAGGLRVVSQNLIVEDMFGSSEFIPHTIKNLVGPKKCRDKYVLFFSLSLRSNAPTWRKLYYPDLDSAEQIKQAVLKTLDSIGVMF